MSAIIDLKKFLAASTDHPEENIKDINELAFLDVILGGPLSKFHTIATGITVETDFGWIGEMGKVGVARQGCNPQRGTASIPTQIKKLFPVKWEASFSQCYAELENTMWEYVRKLKNEEPDLEGSAYWLMVETKFKEALEKMIWRIAWFGDKDAKSISEGGNFSNENDLKYFNWLDGFWKQYFAAATANPVRRITIAANQAATYAEAEAAFTHDKVKQVCLDLKYKSDVRLRRSKDIQSNVKSSTNSDCFVMCTRMFADKVEQMLISQTPYTSEQYKVNEDGLQYIRFNGLDYYPIDIWDEIITQDQVKDVDSAPKFNLPYRAILVKKENQAIATPSTTELANVDVWYDKTSRMNYMEAMDALDAKFALDHYFEVAY